MPTDHEIAHRVSAATLQAIQSASADGRTEISRMLQLLCTDASHGASRCLGQLNAPHDEAQNALRHLPTRHADTGELVTELLMGLGILGCPGTSAGVLCALLSANGPHLGGYAQTLRRTFMVLAGDVADCARRVVRDTLDDLDALVAWPKTHHELAKPRLCQ